MTASGLLLLGAAISFALSSLLLAALAFRRSANGRRFWALPVKGKLTFGRALLSDRSTPFVARLILLLLVGYLLMPFDLIPDVVPVFGQLDDLLIAGATVAVLFLLIPGTAIDAALERAEGRI